MKKTTLALAALGLMIALPAYAADESYSATTKVESDAAGNMEKKVEEKATDAMGTATSAKTEESVKVSSDGDVKAESSSKETTDPKGMGNESTTEKKEMTKTDSDGTGKTEMSSETKSPNATMKESTTTKKGKHKSKRVHKKVTDPKGLGNKSTETTTDTSMMKDNGTVDTKHETTVDGKTTEKTETTSEPAAQ